MSAAINSPESYAKSLKDIYGINIKVQENNGNKVNLFAKRKRKIQKNKEKVKKLIKRIVM